MKFILMLMTITMTINANARDFNRETADRNDLKELAVKNHRPLHSYSEARRILFGNLHLETDDMGYFVYDVYCGIKFRHNIGPGKLPSSNQVNTEHTWPQSKFSRKHGSSIQKSDLHHLFPTDSKANGIRGNNHFTNVNHGTSAYKGCNLSHVGVISATGRDGFEPPADHKGNVARALFYFSIRYDISIPDYEEIVLRQWNWQDPVDQEEIKRNDMIETYQGNRNPFVDDSSLVDYLSDF